MSDYTGVVTTIGQTKIAAAIGGTALNLTTIRVGDGNGAPIAPNAGMTDLVRRVGAAYAIVSSGRDPVNANHWRVTALIPAGDGPFDIREIAVFDAAGDMIAIARHVLVEKRSPAQGAAVELLTDIVFPVSETAQVTVQIQPAAAISIFQMLRAGFTVVESATVTAPPGAPALGRTHVVPAGATGAWAGLAGYLVQWNGIVWVAVNVPEGFHVVAQDKGRYEGTRWLERTAAGWEPGVSRLVQRQPGNYIATPGGTADDITLALDPPITSLTQIIGAPLRPKLTLPNTVTNPVVRIDGLAPLTVVRSDGSPLSRGDLNGIAQLLYDGSLLRLLNLSGNAAGLRKILIFLASDTYVPSAGVFRALGFLWSAGASGGNANTGGAAGGGGSGALAAGFFPTTPGVGVPITLPLGPNGVAAIGADGVDAGTASIGTFLQCTGGQRGRGANGGVQGAAGLGGVASGGMININGNQGTSGYLGSPEQGGFGGPAPFGGSITPISVGSAPSGYFPSGGGAGSRNNGGPGGKGANPLAIIAE